MSKFKDYYNYIDMVSRQFVDEHYEEICNGVLKGGTIEDLIQHDLFEFCDEKFYGSNLIDAGYIIEQSENVVNDHELWRYKDSLEQALLTKAFYTFKNDVKAIVKYKIRKKLIDDFYELEKQGNDNEAVVIYALLKHF